MATAGLPSFGQTGGLLLPLVRSALLQLTGSHGLGLLLCGLPALRVGAQLTRPPRRRAA